jgi:hypothetical protein
MVDMRPDIVYHGLQSMTASVSYAAERKVKIQVMHAIKPHLPGTFYVVYHSKLQ